MLNIPALRFPYQDDLNQASLNGPGSSLHCRPGSNRSWGVHYAKATDPIGSGSNSSQEIDTLLQEMRKLVPGGSSTGQLSGDSTDLVNSLASQICRFRWTEDNLNEFKGRVKDDPNVRELMAYSLISTLRDLSKQEMQEYYYLRKDIFKLIKGLFIDQNLADTKLVGPVCSLSPEPKAEITMNDFVIDWAIDDLMNPDHVSPHINGGAFSLGLLPEPLLEKHKWDPYGSEMHSVEFFCDILDNLDEKTKGAVSAKIAPELVTRIRESRPDDLNFAYSLRLAGYLARSASITSNVEYRQLAASTAMNILKMRLAEIPKHSSSFYLDHDKKVFCFVLETVILSGDKQATKEILDFMNAVKESPLSLDQDGRTKLFKNIRLPQKFVDKCKTDETLSNTMRGIAFKDDALSGAARDLFGPLDIRDLAKLSQQEREGLANAAVDKVASFLGVERNPGLAEVSTTLPPSIGLGLITALVNSSRKPISHDQVEIFKQTLREDILKELSEDVSGIRADRSDNVFIAIGGYNGAEGLIVNALKKAGIPNSTLHTFLPVHWRLTIGFKDPYNISADEKLSLMEQGPNTEYRKLKIWG